MMSIMQKRISNLQQDPLLNMTFYHSNVKMHDKNMLEKYFRQSKAEIHNLSKVQMTTGRPKTMAK